MIKVQVKKGIITVNSVRIIRDTEDVICISLDLKNKHTEYMGYGGDTNSTDCGFHFGAREDTSNVDDPNGDWTEVRVTGLPEEFSKSKVYNSVSMGKYSATIFIVRGNLGHPEGLQVNFEEIVK